MTILNDSYGTEFEPEKFWIREFNYYMNTCDDIVCMPQLVNEYFSINEIPIIVDLNFIDNIDLSAICEPMVDLDAQIDGGRYLYYFITSDFE